MRSNFLFAIADDSIRARRYASLVLDIDPSNVEALRYL